MSKYPTTFTYKPEDRKRIRTHFERLGKDKLFEFYMESLESSASWYLYTHAWDEILPDKKYLEQRDLSDLKCLKRAKELMIVACGSRRRPLVIPQQVIDADDDEKIYAAMVADVMAISKEIDRDEIGVVEFWSEVGVRALDHLINVLTDGSVEALHIKDGGKKKTLHRRRFIENISTVWAKLNDCDFCDCTISDSEGATMVAFIKACLEPLTDITGDASGIDTIKKTVTAIKHEREQWLDECHD